MKLMNGTVVLLMAAVGSLVGGCGGPEAPGAVEVAAAESALTAEGGQAERHHDDNPNPALFEKDARPLGRSMEFWAEQWWRWVYSIPADRNPLLHPTLDSNQNQSGPVYFLAFGDRTSTVPRGRAIAATVATAANDYPCPDPTFQPAPGQSLFDFLSAPVTSLQDSVVSIDATLDGQALTGLLGYRARSHDLTHFVGDLSLQPTLDSCITGTRQPLVVDSYLFMIKPLAPGSHLLTTRVEYPGGLVFARTQHLEVR
jgi:hypothetical protein